MSSSSERHRRRLVSILLVGLLAIPALEAWQRRLLDAEGIIGLANDLRRAADQYRAGDVTTALATLDLHTADTFRIVAAQVMLSRRQPQRHRRDDDNREMAPWSAGQLRALATLHMESALQIYEQRATRTLDELRARVAVAAQLFEHLHATGEAAPDTVERWSLAIGLSALRDGQLWWAASFLDERCRRADATVPLQLACGTAHEQIASLPAHLLLRGGRPAGKDGLYALGPDALQQARMVRDHHLARARRAFEQASLADSTNPEARLRTAYVNLQENKGEQAADVLEELLETVSLDLRTAYLARLFLGTVLDRSGRHEEAAARLREAVALVPAGQAAQLALAASLHAHGRVLEAAAATDRSLTGALEPADPWSSYGLGQFWLVEPALRALRDEARR
jgi:tetratricopeptide (TPR) repeat protein